MKFKFSLSSARTLWNKLWTTGRLKLTNQLQLNTHMDFYFPFWGNKTVVFSFCSKTYSLHGHLSVRSGSESGSLRRQWEIISLLLDNTHWSHCAQPNSTDEGGEGGGQVGKRKNGCCWPEAVDRLLNICKVGWEHTYSLW